MPCRILSCENIFSKERIFREGDFTFSVSPGVWQGDGFAFTYGIEWVGGCRASADASESLKKRCGMIYAEFEP